MSDAIKKNYLNSHFNASQLRADTWNRLKYKALKLAEISRGNKAKVKVDNLFASVQEYLEILDPIERYFAYPGREQFRHAVRYYEKGDYRSFAHRVNHIVDKLFSQAYRRSPSVLEKIDMSHVRHDHVRKQEVKHYFEVLYVANLSHQEEVELRTRLAAVQDVNEDFVYELVIVPSFEDATIAVALNYNIQACVIHYGFTARSEQAPAHLLSEYISELDDDTLLHDNFTMEHGSYLGKLLHRIRPELDLYLITDAHVEDFASYDVYQSFRRVFYGQENHLELHLSIRRGIDERYETPFFNALRQYSRRPTGVFHALPISRGNSVFRSHWIQDMGEFYGTNIFLAETSATTGGLDSLLQPTGALKKAQQRAALAFGARQTFFVTNGTSTANKIVLQAIISPGDIILVDRDCHKSHHYGIVLTGAYPVYLDSYPLVEYSMYGAVPLHEIKHKLLEMKRAGCLDKVKVLLLTNCTFDGLVYNVERVMEEVLAIKPDMMFLWDEAWFAFARFSPTYRQRTAMAAAAALEEKFQSTHYREQYLEYKKRLEAHECDDEFLLNERLLPDPDVARIRVYATQSTHKTLSSLRQGGMIHIYDQDYTCKVEEAFQEAYMTHTSTSPNYQILASLDISRRQVEFEGYELVQKSIETAMTLREKIRSHPLLRKYFQGLGPADVIPEAMRQSGLSYYYDIRSGWHRMNEAWAGDDFVLDPTRLTLYVGLTGIDGDTFKSKYLMDGYGIQVNKTSRNTVLFMTNIGTSRSGVAYLLSVLIKIAQSLQERDKNLTAVEKDILDRQVRALTVELPPLPDFSWFHSAFRPIPNVAAGDLRMAYFYAMHEENCEFLRMDGSVMRAIEAGREVVSAAFVIPYPPGFPILAPGQVITMEILRFLKALDVKEIHGYRPERGLHVFTEDALSRLTGEATAATHKGNGAAIVEETTTLK